MAAALHARARGDCTPPEPTPTPIPPPAPSIDLEIREPPAPAAGAPDSGLPDVDIQRVATAEAAAETPAPRARHITRTDWRWDGEGHRDRWAHLFILDRLGAKPRQLTSGDWGVSDIAWHPDGRMLAVGAVLTFTTHNVPKVVGGHTPVCSALAADLYGAAIETIVPVSSTRTVRRVASCFSKSISTSPKRSTVFRSPLPSCRRSRTRMRASSSSNFMRCQASCVRPASAASRYATLAVPSMIGSFVEKSVYAEMSDRAVANLLYQTKDNDLKILARNGRARTTATARTA